MINKKIKPTEIQNVAWDELQKGGPRSSGSKLDWNLKTQTKKQTDAWEEKKKKSKPKPVVGAGGKTDIAQNTARKLKRRLKIGLMRV